MYSVMTVHFKGQVDVHPVHCIMLPALDKQLVILISVVLMKSIIVSS